MRRRAASSAGAPYTPFKFNEKGFRAGPTTLAVPLAQRSPFLFSQLAHLPSLIINDHRRIHRSSPRSDSFQSLLYVVYSYTVYIS